jgi:hypothetical protein
MSTVICSDEFPMNVAPEIARGSAQCVVAHNAWSHASARLAITLKRAKKLYSPSCLELDFSHLAA